MIDSPNNETPNIEEPVRVHSAPPASREVHILLVPVRDDSGMQPRGNPAIGFVIGVLIFFIIGLIIARAE